jgi:hypothetical protein
MFFFVRSLILIAFFDIFSQCCAGLGQGRCTVYGTYGSGQRFFLIFFVRCLGPGFSNKVWTFGWPGAGLIREQSSRSFVIFGSCFLTLSLGEELDAISKFVRWLLPWRECSASRNVFFFLFAFVAISFQISRAPRCFFGF